MDTSKPLVGIVVGSDSDLLLMAETTAILEEFGTPYETSVGSLESGNSYATLASDRGIKVMIAAAQDAAHLAGDMARATTIPVIAVPLKSQDLDSRESLLRMVEMPSGAPLACVGINAAKNAGLLAIQILATGDTSLIEKIVLYKTKMESDITSKNKKLHSLGVKAYLKLQK